MSSEAITRNDLMNILNEVLPPTPSEYRKLLWTNSGTTYSTGTILNNGELDGFDEVEILSAGFQTSNYVYSRCPIGRDGLIQCWTTSPDNASNASTFMNSASRHYTTSVSGGITFGNGQMTYSGGAYQNWNSRAVPLKVYGIKYERVAPPQVDASDYVIDQDTSGNWRYRKWNSGIIEAWYYASVPFTSAVNQTIGRIPTAIQPFTTPLNLQINGTGNGFVGDLHHLWVANNEVFITPTTAGTYATSVYLCFKN